MSYEPCLCGDPHCGRCFPQWRENAGDRPAECDSCHECAATDERVVFAADGSSELLAVCDSCAARIDDNREPGDSFYEGRG